MNLKTYLVATTAAFASSSAFAADLPVVAEPVEYVAVCDAYGAGYFQLPGKDTCIKISGGVRSWYTSHNLTKKSGLITAGVEGVEDDPATPEDETVEAVDEERNDYTLKTRGYLTLQSMTQTDLMSIKTYTSIFTNWDDSATNKLNIFDAYAQFGFDGVDILTGRTLSLFLPFSGYTLNYNSIPVGGHRALQARATFELVDGFTAAFGVETSKYTGGVEGGLDFTTALKYSSGAFDLGLMGAAHKYDEDNFGYGVSGYMEFKAVEKLTLGVGATYAQDVHSYLGLDGDTTGFSDGDGSKGFNVYGGISYDLTDKVNFAVDGTYASISKDNTTYSVNGVNSTLTYKPVTGLSLSLDGGMWQDSNDDKTAKVTGRVNYSF